MNTKKLKSLKFIAILWRVFVNFEIFIIITTDYYFVFALAFCTKWNNSFFY